MADISLFELTRPYASLLSSDQRRGRSEARSRRELGSTNFKRDIPEYADLYLPGRLNLDDWSQKESRCVT
jgi:hypothetical protein